MTNGILFPWNLWKTISQVESYFPLMEFCFPQVEFYYPWNCGKLVFHGISENYFPLMEAYFPWNLWKIIFHPMESCFPWNFENSVLAISYSLKQVCGYFVSLKMYLVYW